VILLMFSLGLVAGTHEAIEAAKAALVGRETS